MRRRRYVGVDVQPGRSLDGFGCCRIRVFFKYSRPRGHLLPLPLRRSRQINQAWILFRRWTSIVGVETTLSEWLRLQLTCVARRYGWHGRNLAVRMVHRVRIRGSRINAGRRPGPIVWVQPSRPLICRSHNYRWCISRGRRVGSLAGDVRRVEKLPVRRDWTRVVFVGLLWRH